MLIQRGTLRVGDSVVAATPMAACDGWSTSTARTSPRRCPRVRSRSSASPRCPVPATTSWSSTKTGSPARSPTGAARKRNALAARARKRISLEDLESALKETSQPQPHPQGRQRRYGRGARGGPLGIQVDDEVELRVIDRGVGGITETNVNLASASDAIIIGFNVRAEGKATELANREGVEMRYYSVIYQAIDEIEKAPQGHALPIYEERSSAGPRSGRCSSPRRWAISRAAWCSRASCGATPRPGCCGTTWSSPRTSPSPRCGGRRTTSPRSARVTSAV